MKKILQTSKIFLFLPAVIILCFDANAISAGPTVESTVLTVVDSLGRNVIVQRPVERVIALGNYRLEALRVLNASERVVGIGTNARKNSSYYFPNMCAMPDVGTWQEPNHEVIVSLHPDLVVTSAHDQRVSKLEHKLKPFNIALIGLDFYRDDRVAEELKTLGRIMGKEHDARKKRYLRIRISRKHRIDNVY